MNIFRKIEKALDRMMNSNPVVTLIGVITSLVGLAFIGAFIVKYAPLLAITVAGVALTWIMVLFISKFLKEIQR